MIPYKDLNPSRHFPFVTLLLIVMNVAVFALEMFLPSSTSYRLLYQYAAIPMEFKLGRNLPISTGLPFLTLVTSLFLHGGFFHLAGNMLYLWIFGDNVEDRMGSARFLFFYLLCGVIATLVQVYADFSSKVPVLGASGAIAGVLAAYLLLFPKARVMVLVPIFYFLRTLILPAWLVLGGWILLQVVAVEISPLKTGGGIAYYAHLGGFLTGLLLTPALKKRHGI